VPRFYFDAIMNGDPSRDSEGTELDSRAVARQEGVRAAAEMAKDPRLDGDERSITVSVREGAEPVATIRLSLKIEGAA
jgi:hypothetical protein